MSKTIVRPTRDLRNKYSELAAKVKKGDHVIITNNGRGESVLIGLREYAQFQEFLHVRYVKEKLMEAEKSAQLPGAWHSEEEHFAALSRYL